MKTLKFVCWSLFVVITAIAIAGCSKTSNGNSTGADKKDKKIVIGCSMQGNQSAFIQYLAVGIWKYKKENAKDIDLEVRFADDDSAKQLSQIESYISKGVDAIIINPVDKVQSAAAVDTAFEAGIPVITINTISDSKHVTAHVGSNDVEAGKLQMQRLIDVCGPEARVAYINAVLGHSAQILREKGYKEILKKYPKVKLVCTDTADWSADKAMKLVENWIQGGKDIDCIACEGDCQLLGVITAVENAGKIGKIKLSGMDCVNEVLKAIKEGKVDSSLWQDGIGQGENALRIAIKAAKGEKVEDYSLPFEVCTQKNVEKYIEKAKKRDELAKEYF